MADSHQHSRHTASKTWIVITVMLAMMLAALDMTIVGTAMPSIISDLHGLAIYSWVFSAYLLASTVPVPIFSKLADIYGRKKLFIVGTFIFTIGSLLCGLSSNMIELIIFRAVQGLGAAGVLPIALTIIGDVFTLEQRARIQGLFSGVWGVSAVVGPLLGALIVEHSNWRWVFDLNVPIGILVILILWIAFKEEIHSTKHRLDWNGTILLSVGVTTMLLALVSHISRGDTILLSLITGITLIGFIWWERRAAEPVLPGVLFQNRMVVVSNSVNFFAGAVMFGLISYVPLYVQGVLGGSPTLAGQAITPMLIGWPLASLIAGPIFVRIGFRLLGIVGGVLIASGSGLLISSHQFEEWIMNISLFAIGIGMGLSLTGLLIAAQNVVPWNLRGTVTGASQFFRTIGGSIGVALMGAVLNDQLALRTLHGKSAVNAGQVTADLLSSHARSALNPGLRHFFAHVLGGSLYDVFVVGFLFSLVVTILVFFIPGDKIQPQTIQA